MILVDTNVLVDVVGRDPVWADWSRQQLNVAAATDDMAINDVVYAELSIGDRRVEELNEMLVKAGISLAPIPRAACFWPAKPFGDIARQVVARPGCCPVSSSAPMRWCRTAR